MSGFLTKGGAGMMDAAEQKEWLKSCDGAYMEKLMSYSEGDDRES